MEKITDSRTLTAICKQYNMEFDNFFKYITRNNDDIVKFVYKNNVYKILFCNGCFFPYVVRVATKTKIYDDEGTLQGYKMGACYLLKHYTFKNYYSWIITTNKSDASLFQCEFDKKLESGQIMAVSNFKEGLKTLIDLI